MEDFRANEKANAKLHTVNWPIIGANGPVRRPYTTSKRHCLEVSNEKTSIIFIRGAYANTMGRIVLDLAQ